MISTMGMKQLKLRKTMLFSKDIFINVRYANLEKGGFAIFAIILQRFFHLSSDRLTLASIVKIFTIVVALVTTFVPAKDSDYDCFMIYVILLI